MLLLGILFMFLFTSGFSIEPPLTNVSFFDNFTTLSNLDTSNLKNVIILNGVYYHNSYFVPINISNPNSELTNYQVKLIVPYNSHMNSNYSDLRFSFKYPNGTEVEIPYWIQSYNSSSATVWVKVPDLKTGNTTIYMYYGNPNATSKSNGNAVFEFFDDFNGNALNTSKWINDNTQSITLNNSWIDIVAGSAASWTRSGILKKGPIPTPCVIEAYGGRVSSDAEFSLMKSQTPSSTSYSTWVTWQKEGTDWAVRNNYEKTSYGAYYTKVSSEIAHLMMVVKSNNSVDMYINGNYFDSPTLTTLTDKYLLLGSDNSGRESKWDWVFIRKYAPSEPTVRFGSEEINNDSGIIFSKPIDFPVNVSKFISLKVNVTGNVSFYIASEDLSNITFIGSTNTTYTFDLYNINVSHVGQHPKLIAILSQNSTLYSWNITVEGRDIFPPDFNLSSTIETSNTSLIFNVSDFSGISSCWINYNNHKIFGDYLGSLCSINLSYFNYTDYPVSICSNDTYNNTKCEDVNLSLFGEINSSGVFDKYGRYVVINNVSSVEFDSQSFVNFVNHTVNKLIAKNLIYGRNLLINGYPTDFYGFNINITSNLSTTLAPPMVGFNVIEMLRVNGSSGSYIQINFTKPSKYEQLSIWDYHNGTWRKLNTGYSNDELISPVINNFSYIGVLGIPGLSMISFNDVFPPNLGQTINHTVNFSFIPITKIERWNLTPLYINSTNSATHSIYVGDARTDINATLNVTIVTPLNESAEVNITLNGNLLAKAFVPNGTTEILSYSNATIVPNSVNNITYSSNTSQSILVKNTTIIYRDAKLSCDLYINGSLSRINSSTDEGKLDYFVSPYLSNGDYVWNIKCTTDQNVSSYTPNRTLGIGQNVSRCAVLLDSGRTYYTNKNLAGGLDCISFGNNNITLNCKDHSIPPIEIKNDHISIENCDDSEVIVTDTSNNSLISNSVIGYFSVKSGSNIRFYDNVIGIISLLTCSNCSLINGSTSKLGNIYISSSNNVLIKNYNISANYDGIDVGYSKNITILNTLINGRKFVPYQPNNGINVDHSSNVKLENISVYGFDDDIEFSHVSNGSVISCYTSNAYHEGIESYWGNNVSVVNSTSLNNYHGVLIFGTNNSLISNVKALNDFIGIDVEQSYNVTLNSSLVERDNIDLINESNYNFSMWNNSFVYSIHSYFFNTSSYYTNTTELPFTILILHVKNISYVNVSSFPNTELNWSFNNLTNTIEGKIRLDGTGVDSLLINLTDSKGNKIQYLHYIYSANDSYKDMVLKNLIYYFRPEVISKHGQPQSSMALLQSLPSSTEVSDRSMYLFTIDELPEFPFGIIRNISVDVWYKVSDISSVGLQWRLAFGGGRNIENNSIPASPSQYSFIKVNFNNLDIPYLGDEWYYLAVKGKKDSMSILSSPNNLSYINISYTPISPFIISYYPLDNLSVLSSLSYSNFSNMQTLVDGKGVHSIEFKMPRNSSYYVLFDGNLCKGENCNFTSNGNFVNVTARLGSVHNITIEEDNEPPKVSFTCSPTYVPIGRIITCSCTATDNSGYVNVSYTKHPDTSKVGTFFAKCTAVDPAGNSAIKTIKYTVYYPKLLTSGNSHSYYFYLINKSACINILNFPINKLCIYLNKPERNVRVSLNLVNDSSIKTSLYAYKSVNITSNINKSLISNITIEFNINEEWINTNNFSHDEIKFLRYYNGSFVDLPVTFVNSSDGYSYYESVSHGFGYFVIGGKHITPSSSNVNNNLTNNSISGTKNKTNVPTNVSGYQKGTNKIILLISITLAIIGFGVLMYLIRKHT